MPEPVRRHPVPDRAVLEAAAAAFMAYDVDALVDLFLDDGVMHIIGMDHETGATQMRAGSLEHTFNQERDVRYRADVRDFGGEPLVVVTEVAAAWGVPTVLHGYRYH